MQSGMNGKFDIGNLVYVLLTILFLAIGAFGKKKKPVQQVREDEQDNETQPDGLRSQFEDLFRDITAVDEVENVSQVAYDEIESVEDGPALDVLPEEIYSPEEEIISEAYTPLSSNIDYHSQAHSSLDTRGLDEGEADFNYEKDSSSMVFNGVSNEYTAQMTGHEKEIAELVEEFDARTAFVYSEIFKRKEF